MKISSETLDNISIGAKHIDIWNNLDSITYIFTYCEGIKLTIVCDNSDFATSTFYYKGESFSDLLNDEAEFLEKYGIELDDENQDKKSISFSLIEQLIPFVFRVDLRTYQNVLSCDIYPMNDEDTIYTIEHQQEMKIPVNHYAVYEKDFETDEIRNKKEPIICDKQKLLELVQLSHV